jgi:hypothetical protein
MLRAPLQSRSHKSGILGRGPHGVVRECRMQQWTIRNEDPKGLGVLFLDTHSWAFILGVLFLESGSWYSRNFFRDVGLIFVVFWESMGRKFLWDYFRVLPSAVHPNTSRIWPTWKERTRFTFKKRVFGYV